MTRVSSIGALQVLIPLYCWVLKSTMPPNQSLDLTLTAAREDDAVVDVVRVALLGTGMMGQEHASYLSGFHSTRIDYLCDPHQPSLESCLKVIKDFGRQREQLVDLPTLLHDEKELLLHVNNIDLLVIATPNYLHTDQLLEWGRHDLTILVEKPVAVSAEQHERLLKFSQSDDCRARIWVAMEYRFIPAVAKLISLLPTIGDIQMVTIRENRYPFLHKVGDWNRDRAKTGDTLVEKCCHFFDLFRLITGKEACLKQVRALAQRGINYENEEALYDVPIIDSAYVTMPFKSQDRIKTMGCLELCMYAEGSRHQEEIIVTGTKGRLEAYMPENKVYVYERPSFEEWSDRSVPPPKESIRQHVYDCSDVKSVNDIQGDLPTHGGYHYSSTAVEWYHLLNAMKVFEETSFWAPKVSLNDGLRAVEIGLQATRAIVNEQQCQDDDDACC